MYNIRVRKNKRREVAFVFPRDNEQTVCEADELCEARVCEYNRFVLRILNCPKHDLIKCDMRSLGNAEFPGLLFMY